MILKSFAMNERKRLAAAMDKPQGQVARAWASACDTIIFTYRNDSKQPSESARDSAELPDVWKEGSLT